MKQNLRRILLCAALAGLPFIHMKAYDWVPVGDNIDVNGFTTAGGIYTSQDYLGDNAPGALKNRSFVATGGDSTLYIYGNLHTGNPDPNNPNATLVAGPIASSLKVNSDVRLDATSNDMTINIMEDVVIEPYFQAPTPLGPGWIVRPESECSQIYFRTGNGFTTTINVNNNLEFRGKTTATGWKDLLVTFAGRGTVVFNMADGTSVKFMGQIDTTSPQVLLDPETGLFSTLCDVQANPGAHDAAGTKVFVLMDQTKDDVDCSKNKVLFKRQGLDTVNNDQRVLVEVGPNSVLTYLSTNPTGLTSELFPDGYGAIAFDPSNNGTGRMVLLVKGAYKLGREGVSLAECESDPLGNVCDMITEKYPFNDGAILLNGHYVPAFDAQTISGCLGGTETEGATPGYDFSKPAGIKAIMRVVDNQLFEDSQVYGVPYDPTAAQRRGLLVVNDVVNHGKLFSEPYWDLYTDPAFGFLGVLFSPSNPNNNLFNTRRGFHLGVNGVLDVYHNTFLDHVSGASNLCDPLAECDYANPMFGGDEGLLKNRNPSALIVDGLDVALFISGNPFILDPFSAPTPSDFEAADPFTQANSAHAVMQLRGDGAVYVRSSVSTAFGYMYNLFTASGTNPIDNPNLDWTNALAVGVGQYDGFNLSPNADTVQAGEGEHVLDVEGPLEVRGIANNTATDLATACQPRDYATVVEKAGTLSSPSVLIDYTGREVLTGDDDLIERPLLNDGTIYARYNSATMFFNNNAMFFDAIWRHSDATKFVDGMPNLSEPAITGGERLWFVNAYWGDNTDNRLSDPNRFRLPELQLFNSTLELQESLNASGVRFVVKDVPKYFVDSTLDVQIVGREGDNTSIVRFFDHGDPLDTMLTGFGRIFLCGSSLNTMCDGSNNYVTESCHFNVFKHNRIVSGHIPTIPASFEDPLEEASQVLLSLQNGDQFHPDIAAGILQVPSLREKQRAHHLFMFAQPPALPIVQPGGQLPSANLVIGWSDNTKVDDVVEGDNAPFGDSGYFPGSFPYPGEPLIDESVNFPGGGEVFFSEPLNLDALTVPAATLSIDGSIICFGSFDQDGNSIPVPVRGDNDNGVVYVKHGGKITITRPAPLLGGDIPGFGERTSIPYQCVFSTMLAQRIWNDYNFDGNQRDIQLSGIIDIPHDQVIYDTNFGVQPYNFTNEMFDARRNVTDGFVRLSFLNEDRDVRLALGNASGAEEVTIGWHFREVPDLNLGLVPGTAGNILPKSTKAQRAPINRKVAAISETLKWLTRATESVGDPVERPTDLLYVGPGDDITQWKVAGATMSDPFALAISGDGLRPVSARVREFVSLKSTAGVIADHFISEGAHAVLFLDFNGQIGLGSRAWNEHSVNAWNLLGKDYVTICPLGDGCVNLNSNLLVTDRLAIIASTTFSADEDNRLTFFSQEPLEIRVPANGELDLSSFGQTENLQQIAFAGKVRLVFEENATLRLPNSGNSLVLYFNDESELVFEGENVPNTFLPFTDAVNNLNGTPNNAPIANSRIRIVGSGQIWLNKNASMVVNGDVYVGVETDELSPFTDLTISIQRQGALWIGDENVSGGTFQVGNKEDLSNIEVEHNINFNLILNGPDAKMHIDREGFFGLGAGILNKNGAPNGDATSANNPVLNLDGSAATVVVAGTVVPVFNPDIDPTSGVWQVKRLFNVNNVTIQVDHGIIEHNRIADGSTNEASLWAIGPANSYTLNLNGIDNGTVRGGGNLMWVPVEADPQGFGPIFTNIWDYDGPVSDASGNYVYQSSILAAGPLLIDRAYDLPYTNYSTNGKSFSFSGGDASADFFDLLAFKLLPTQNVKKIDVGTTNFVPLIAFTTNASVRYGSVILDGAEIMRLDGPAVIPGGGTVADAINLGALGATVNNAGQPTQFVIIQ